MKSVVTLAFLIVGASSSGWYDPPCYMMQQKYKFSYSVMETCENQSIMCRKPWESDKITCLKNVCKTARDVDEYCHNFGQLVDDFFDKSIIALTIENSPNKQHPCKLVSPNQFKVCYDSYKNVLDVKNCVGDEKCMQKSCKKTQNDPNSVFIWENGDRVELIDDWYSDSSSTVDGVKFCKDLTKQFLKYENKGGDSTAIFKDNHHPCHADREYSSSVSDTVAESCVDDYEKFYHVCEEKSSAKNEFKKCFKNECEKNLKKGDIEKDKVKDICAKMEKQSRKYWKKVYSYIKQNL